MGKSIKLEQFNDMVTITFDQENSVAMYLTRICLLN